MLGLYELLFKKWLSISNTKAATPKLWFSHYLSIHSILVNSNVVENVLTLLHYSMKQPGYQYAVLMLVLFKASGNVKNMSSCQCNCLSRDKGKGKRRPFPQKQLLECPIYLEMHSMVLWQLIEYDFAYFKNAQIVRIIVDNFIVLSIFTY